MTYQDRRRAASWGPIVAMALQVILAIVLLIVYVAKSHAQTAEPVPNALPSCWPKSVGGKGTFHRWAATGDGAYIGWWCPQPDGTWSRVGLVAVPGYTIKEPPGPFASIADELSAYWVLNVTGKPDPAHAGWHYTAMAMDEALAKTKPADLPPPVWLVAPATVGTRPLYSVVNGALVLASGRATVGQACDCTAPFVKSTSTYCVPAGQTVLVTLCRKAP